jgi:hypothetical protein
MLLKPYSIAALSQTAYYSLLIYELYHNYQLIFRNVAQFCETTIFKGKIAPYISIEVELHQVNEAIYPPLRPPQQDNHRLSIKVIWTARHEQDVLFWRTTLHKTRHQCTEQHCSCLQPSILLLGVRHMLYRLCLLRTETQPHNIKNHQYRTFGDDLQCL